MSLTRYDGCSVLVVGGTGFIGHHLTQKLLQCGAQVTTLGLTGKNSVGEHLIVDMANLSKLQSELKQRSFNYVFNLGGYIEHGKYRSSGRQVIEAHFLGLMNLLSCLCWDELQGFVQIGSSDEYGNLPAPQVETLREAPISPYSVAKLSACQLIQTLARTENFPGTVLRLFLVYGPGQDTRRFLPQIITHCLEGNPFPVSEGMQQRDFCYIDDVVEGMLMAALTQAAHGEVINIASGQPRTIRSVVEEIVTLLGQGKPHYGEIPYRIGENMSLYANIDKAKDILGWNPKTSFSEGLDETIAWYKGIQ